MNYGIPGPNDAIIPFSVFIIESPSKIDLAMKQTEGKLIAQALHLAQVPHHLYIRKTGRSFRKLLRDVIPNHLNKHHQQGDAVVVHLSVHGNMHEIGLTDGTDISWDEMYSWFSDINFECKGSLVLCMSSCMGAFAGMMTLGNVELPFRVVVGSDDKPEWSETAVGFAVFYHLLQHGRTLQEAAAEMREASGHEGFQLIDAQTIKELHEDMAKENEALPGGD